ENSIIHGLENKKEEGLIKIKIFRENEKLIISVKDNGIGMDEKEIERIISRPFEDEGYKIGLRNTLERIKLFYGEEYGLKIRSNSSLGTEVDIILPYPPKGEMGNVL
ncbi:MAG: sensor histidine kinase, partial [Dictyoglomus sp.]